VRDHRRRGGRPLDARVDAAAIQRMSDLAVRFEGIDKRFLGVLALRDVTVDIARGSCHALCGENGAGKSTLGKILAGIHEPDRGRVFVNGAAMRFSTPRDALAAGVGMVHQELSLCENMTVAENLCLSALPRRRGFAARDATRVRAREMLAAIGADVDVDRRVGDLPIARRQMVQIAAAVGSGARVLVFDEPTSSLSQADAERLYELIARLRLDGVTCIYVSHRMPEVFRLCDTITVLRDGQVVGTRPAAELDESAVVQMMIGRALGVNVVHEGVRGGDERLRVQGFSAPGKFEDVNLTLHSGEIVGLAGLVGAGRSEIAAALFGLDAHSRGQLFVNGQSVNIRTPADAIRAGIGLVPEDRKRQALVPLESSVRNASLAVLSRLTRLTWVRRGAEHALVDEYFRRLRIRTSSSGAPVASLSGGNQQKVVLARWLAARSRILILDEPTRGVDVGAKAEIHELIAELAAGGAAILLISSELPELLALSMRIITVRGGRIVGRVERQDASEELLLRQMAGLA
jgi:ABC-type sugar transport system ATPase subunit